MAKPWWVRDAYNDATPLPDPIITYAGPKGPALVRLWPNGKTSRGWGLTGTDGTDGFMPRYMREEFIPRRVLHGYNYGRWAYALVMRSVRLVAIDIDGKNGGFESAETMPLSKTLAETSRSQNGLHLFYRSPDVWSPNTGYGEQFNDHIGVFPGIDIRSVGCVYHYPTQRWNTRYVASLPASLAVHLITLTEQRTARIEAAKSTATLDPTEVLIMQDQLERELNSAIPAGRRNTTLFAIGSQMKLANVPDWEDKVANRALSLGLDQAEVSKLIHNISSYGA